MTTLSLPHPDLAPQAPALILRRLLRQAWQINPLLTAAGVLQLAMIPLLLLAWALDPKTILGMPAWIKPIKFALSISIYLFTLLWLLTYVQGRVRLKQWVANAIVVAFVVEFSLITMQVIRDTTSHFNAATPFDRTVFSIMGGFIVLVAMLDLLLAIWLIRQRLPDPVLAWGLRLGVLLAFVGMAVAFLMTSGPTPAQLQQLQAGESVAAIGAHSVGVEDGGAGLPLLGWSTEGGDLRVPHFVGLHAMQILPLIGWLLTRRRVQQRVTARGRLFLVWIAGLTYLGLTALLTWQALRGQAIIAPDRVTWTALFALIGSALLVSGGVYLRNRVGENA
jgi:hypothetical protein